MPITTISSGEFELSASEAQRCAKNGPVLITEGGIPSYVLLSFEDYQRLAGRLRNIADALAMPSNADFEVDLPPAVVEHRPVDFS